MIDLTYINLAFLIISSLISFLFILLFKGKLELFSSDYNTIQKLHLNYVPPLGGFIIYINFYIYLLIFEKDSFLLEANIFIPSLFIILIGLKEDIYSNVSPILRFFIIFIASFIFIYNSESLPDIDINFINKFFYEYPIIEVLFYSIGLTALSNGVNMIDGINGLAGFTVISVIFGLISILIINDVFINFFSGELLSLLTLLIIFLLFNFPYGKIFLGDAGAYWLGWLMGVFVIKIFSVHNLHTWVAVLLIIYPSLEVVFSTIRKLYQKKSPLKPDLNHIHIKLYYKLKGPVDRSNRFNSFTTLCLMPLWFTPSVLTVWGTLYSHLSILGIIFIIIMYLSFYLIIPEVSKNQIKSL